MIILSTFKKYQTQILLAIIVLLTICVYYNSLDNQFLNDWDDGAYITNNPHIKHGPNESLVKNAFTKFSNGHYHPLTTISYGIEYKLFGLEAKPFHVFNLLFHIVNALLVFAFIKLLVNDILIAFLTALLFAIHPMHVESVAWISDRKDLLCTIYYVGAMCTYLLYLKKGRNKLLAITFLLFILALLSKAMAITLPIVFFVLDYFRNRKFSSKTVIEKIPFLILSIVFGYISIQAQKANDALGDMTTLGFIDRIAFSGYSLVMYIEKLFWFADISAYYNYPLLENGKYPIIYYILPLLLIVLFLILYKIKTQRKVIVFSFGFFLVTIALVLQIVPAGSVIMADRYTYLPYLGLFFMIAFFIKHVIGFSKVHANVVYAIIFIYVLSCLYFAIGRTKVWHDSLALWSDTIKKNPDAALPYNDRATFLINAKQFELALNDLNKAIEIRPTYVKAHYNRGIVNLELKKFNEAISDFTYVVTHKSSYAIFVYMNRGDAYMRVQNYTAAIDDFSAAIQNNPNLVQGYYNRGLGLYTINKFEDAVRDFNTTLKLNPEFIQAGYMRGLSYYKLQNYKQAYSDITTAGKMGYRVNQNLVNEIFAKLNQKDK